MTMHGASAVDFWGELDADVLGCLTARHGEMTPAEIGRAVGISEHAVCSILGMLVAAGKVRICSVERIV
jgi:predicted ArsR family transcriptional regulator